MIYFKKLAHGVLGLSLLTTAYSKDKQDDQEGRGFKRLRDNEVREVVHVDKKPRLDLQDKINNQMQKGNAYYHGFGVTQSYLKALYHYLKAAEMGSAVGQYVVGHMYYTGIEVQINLHNAEKWLNLSAEQGYPLAQNELGVLLSYALNYPVDYNRAFSLFSKAAAQGNWDAMLNLALEYYTGRTTPWDYFKCIKWLEEAIKLNASIPDFYIEHFGKVYCAIASAYQNGTDQIEKNPEKAIEYYEKAITFKNAEASERIKTVIKDNSTDLMTLPMELILSILLDSLDDIYDAPQLFMRTRICKDFETLLINTCQALELRHPLIAQNRKEYKNINFLFIFTNLVKLSIPYELNSCSYFINLNRLTKLKDLSVNVSDAQDFSDHMTILLGLTDLTKLKIESGYVGLPEESSSFTKLTNLGALILENCQLNVIPSLSKLSNLTVLNMNANLITDLSPLSEISNLRELALNKNEGTLDMSSLSHLTNLKKLDMAENIVRNESSLLNLTNLEKLNLSECELVTVPPVSGLTNLTRLNLSYNNIDDVSSISALTNLVHLDISYTSVSDISSLSHLTNLTDINTEDSLLD